MLKETRKYVERSKRLDHPQRDLPLSHRITLITGGEHQ